MKNVRAGIPQNDAKEKRLFSLNVDYNINSLYYNQHVIKIFVFLLCRFAVFLPSHFTRKRSLFAVQQARRREPLTWPFGGNDRDAFICKHMFTNSGNC